MDGLGCYLLALCLSQVIVPGPLFDQAALQKQVAQLSTEEEQAQLGSFPTVPPSSKETLTDFGRLQPKGHLGWGPQAALIGGQALDVGSTAYNFHRGYIEQNPVYTWMGQQPTAGIAALKALQTAMMLHGANKLAENHPTAAKVLTYVGGAVPALTGLHNLMLPGPPKE